MQRYGFIHKKQKKTSKKIASFDIPLKKKQITSLIYHIVSSWHDP